jgi:hypothetical protein
MVDCRQRCQAPGCSLPGRMGGVGRVNNALTIDLKGIEQPPPRTSDASLLRKITEDVNRATAKVETQWVELPSDERKAYTDFAYTIIEFRYNDLGRVRAVLERTRAGFNLFLITLKGEQDVFIEYVIAMRRFVYAIIDAIERNQSGYQKMLAESLEGLPGEVGEPMTAGEARERLRKIRYQVLD